MTFEDALLQKIDLERKLSVLDPADREMMVLILRLEDCPDGWKGPWPPQYESIGRFIGRKYEGEPLSEAAIRYRRDVVLDMWAGKRGKLRRNPKQRVRKLRASRKKADVLRRNRGKRRKSK